MADSTWFLDNESRIYTLIKSKTYDDLKKKYPKITFTTSSEIQTEPKFPSVYIHELQPSERQQTLAGDYIGSVETTFEVRVTVNTQKTDCVKVLKPILQEFKNMRFNLVSVTPPTSQANMFYTVARFRRILGSGETLINYEKDRQ